METHPPPQSSVTALLRCLALALAEAHRAEEPAIAPARIARAMEQVAAGRVRPSRTADRWIIQSADARTTYLVATAQVVAALTADAAHLARREMRARLRVVA